MPETFLQTPFDSFCRLEVFNPVAYARWLAEPTQQSWILFATSRSLAEVFRPPEKFLFLSL